MDGGTGRSARRRIIDTLENQRGSQAQILSNVRVMGEGVDVPDLEAVIFFDPRKSQIETVQEV